MIFLYHNPLPLLLLLIGLVSPAVQAAEASPTPSSRIASVPPAPIPDSLVIGAAERTLAKGADTRQIADRAREVKTFLLSMGGERWFGSYQSQFSIPKSVEEYKVASLLGLSDKRLGHYYLHTRPISSEVLTALSCTTPDPKNQTSKGFCALAHWDAVIALNDDVSRQQFLSLARQFLEEQAEGQWRWQSDLPLRNLKAPWISALTQSLGISVLIRAYQITEERPFLDGARAAIGWFERPLGEGGLANALPVGLWFEEYPDVERPSRVLNGHMWALFGLWDYYRVTGDKSVQRLFEKGVEALEAYLYRYDVSGWSVYSIENNVDFVSGAYQQFIIEQLRVLETITDSRILRAYREIWECSLHNDALFIHVVAAEFNKARAAAPPRLDYPMYCKRIPRMRRAVTEAERAVERASIDLAERRSRLFEVFEWLPSVGGEQWYANYLNKFGAPRTQCVFRFQGGDLTSRELGHYYLRHPVSDGKPAAEPDCFAKLGAHYGIEDRYTKTMVAHIALAAWDAYLTTSEARYRERFLALAKELMSSQVDGRWNWAIELPTRGIKAPWISGMTQSLGISVLLRAHALTGNPAYLAGATGALEWMRRPVASGGVAMRAEKGVWYEEYPSIQRPSHVLNGHVWALFGIWDYFRVTRDPEVAAMFREGVAALVNEIDRYDVGYWVVYDQLNRVDMINGYYLDFVVEQLRVLHAITGEDSLARRAFRWQRYLRDRSLFGHMAFEEHAKTLHPPRAKDQPPR